MNHFRSKKIGFIDRSSYLKHIQTPSKSVHWSLQYTPEKFIAESDQIVAFYQQPPKLAAPYGTSITWSDFSDGVRIVFVPSVAISKSRNIISSKNRVNCPYFRSHKWIISGPTKSDSSIDLHISNISKSHRNRSTGRFSTLPKSLLQNPIRLLHFITNLQNGRAL